MPRFQIGPITIASTITRPTSTAMGRGLPLQPNMAWDNSGTVLFLYRAEDHRWYAAEAQADDPNPVDNGHVKFIRSRWNIDDIAETHKEWLWWYFWDREGRGGAESARRVVPDEGLRC